jgi:5-bromo-4-chloroindolyl phosphate hydrolysis protein
MRARLATGAALASAVAIFTGVFLITTSLLWSAVIATAGSIGVYLMMDARTKVQVESDDYADDAERKVSEALQLVRDIRKLSNDVTAPAAKASLQNACQYVPELFERVKANSPNSLYSTASQIGAHLTSLLGVVKQYLDIQRKPALYKDPDALKASGDDAFRRFADFTIESVRLVNQGDLATYRANLETVAPPALPSLS